MAQWVADALCSQTAASNACTTSVAEQGGQIRVIKRISSSKLAAPGGKPAVCVHDQQPAALSCLSSSIRLTSTARAGVQDLHCIVVSGLEACHSLCEGRQGQPLADHLCSG